MSIVKKMLREAEKLAVDVHKKPQNYNELMLPALAEIEGSIPCGSVLLCSGRESFN